MRSSHSPSQTPPTWALAGLDQSWPLVNRSVVADTGPMVDLPGGCGQRDPGRDIARPPVRVLPSCQLILPLSVDPDAASGIRAGAGDRDPLPVARCGLCKRPVDTATWWLLHLRLRCPDCGALIASLPRLPS